MPNHINPRELMDQNNMFQNNIIEQHKFIQRNNLYIPQQTYYPPNFNPMLNNNQIYNPICNNNIKSGNPRYISIDYLSCYNEIIEKLIQDMLPSLPDKEKTILFDKLIPFIYELSEDQYGNYVIQKFIEFSNQDRRFIIYKQIEKKMYSLSIDMYGCRVLQKLIEMIDHSIVKLLLIEIKNDIKDCILNKNGNHVIQKFVQRIPKGEYQDITKVVYENVNLIYIQELRNCN